jgi:hypothetical protein
MKITAALFLLPFLSSLHAFAPQPYQRSGAVRIHRRNGQPQLQRQRQQRRLRASSLRAINNKRRKELGLPDDADEYDLDVALNNNTDAGITKIVAGSFILVMIALLVVGLV